MHTSAVPPEKRPRTPSGKKPTRVAFPLAVAGSVASLMLTPNQAHAEPLPMSTTTKLPSTLPATPAGALHTSAPEKPPATVKIVAGDTLWDIATKYGLTVDYICTQNGLDPNTTIFPGQTLFLSSDAGSNADPTNASVSNAETSPPAAATHTVVQGETLSDISAAYGISVARLVTINNIPNQNLIFPGTVLVVSETGSASETSSAVETDSMYSASYAQTPEIESTEHVPSGYEPLSAPMRENANMIISIGLNNGVPAEGIIIALATAAQESSLRNVDYGDSDSLGLFQQRPSSGWGSPEQLLDPTYSIRAFYGGDMNPNPEKTRGLLDIPGWENMTLTQAAQAVQISGHPDAYAQWEASARKWFTDLTS